MRLSGIVMLLCCVSFVACKKPPCQPIPVPDDVKRAAILLEGGILCEYTPMHGKNGPMNPSEPFSKGAFIDYPQVASDTVLKKNYKTELEAKGWKVDGMDEVGPLRATKAGALPLRIIAFQRTDKKCPTAQVIF